MINRNSNQRGGRVEKVHKRIRVHGPDNKEKYVFLAMDENVCREDNYEQPEIAEYAETENYGVEANLVHDNEGH